MNTISFILALAHLVGIVFGIGAATVKIILLFKCRSNAGFIPIFLGVLKPVTMVIVIGQFLLTLSAIGLMVSGYPFTTIIILKIILLGCLWILGPTIDKVFEPKFEKLAPRQGESADPQFVKALNQFLAAEVFANGLFYAALILGLLL